MDREIMREPGRNRISIGSLAVATMIAGVISLIPLTILSKFKTVYGQIIDPVTGEAVQLPALTSLVLSHPLLLSLVFFVFIFGLCVVKEAYKERARVQRFVDATLIAVLLGGPFLAIVLVFLPAIRPTSTIAG
ncbi:MAG: hypothetical protein ACYS47_02355 [Planctomycetota bacterium]|jgi:hypothetical protein